MTTRKKKTSSKRIAGKLKLKKETIKDLDANPAAKNVKGGWGGPATVGCKTADCPKNPSTIVCGVLIG